MLRWHIYTGMTRSRSLHGRIVRKYNFDAILLRARSNIQKSTRVKRRPRHRATVINGSVIRIGRNSEDSSDEDESSDEDAEGAAAAAAAAEQKEETPEPPKSPTPPPPEVRL